MTILFDDLFLFLLLTPLVHIGLVCNLVVHGSYTDCCNFTNHTGSCLSQSVPGIIVGGVVVIIIGVLIYMAGKFLWWPRKTLLLWPVPCIDRKLELLWIATGCRLLATVAQGRPIGG